MMLTNGITLRKSEHMIACLVSYHGGRLDYETWMTVISAMWSEFTYEECLPVFKRLMPEERPEEYARKYGTRYARVSIGSLIWMYGELQDKTYDPGIVRKIRRKGMPLMSLGKNKVNIYDKYKGVEGDVHRIGIIFTDPENYISGEKVHYSEQSFQYIICKECECCKMYGEAKARYGTVIVKYNTNQEGGLVKPFGYSMYSWYFADKTYKLLAELNKTMPLTERDILVRCESNKFQKLSFQACKEQVWTMKENLKASVLEKYASVWDTVKVTVGSDLTRDQIQGIDSDDGTSSGIDSVITDDTSTIGDLHDQL